MNNEYIIVNKSLIEKTIEELKKEYEQKEKVNDNQWCSIIAGKIISLKTILSQSTPLLPEINAAIEFGKDVRDSNTFINTDENNTPFVDYFDTTTETNHYISNFKLDI